MIQPFFVAAYGWQYGQQVKITGQAWLFVGCQWDNSPELGEGEYIYSFTDELTKKHRLNVTEGWLKGELLKNG